MNFLAHLFLSCNNDDLTIGNFIADFIRNKEVGHFSSGVQLGIQLHRQIDRYTDNHPEVRKGTRRLQAVHHKYAPVVIDILYDYLLATNWSKYHSDPLEVFCQQVYRLFEDRMDEIPAKLQRNLPTMIENNWLVRYGTWEGLDYTFKRMDQRAKFPSNFKAATQQLKEDLGIYTEEFHRFFPEVNAFVCKYLKE